MTKISNTEEGNQYYKLINEYIEKYIIAHKIKPSNVKKYFRNSKNRTSFLERYKLIDIDGIKRVLDDVIDDWHFLEKDDVMKFERFITEDIGLVKIDASGMDYERVLADLYGSSVGHVESTSDEDHKYNVTDFGKKINVVIYSKKDIDSFKKSLLPILVKEANESDIDIHKVGIGLKSGKEIRTAISFSLSSVVSEEKLIEYLNSILNERKTLEIITSFINDYDILRSNKNYVYKQEYLSYHIWELEDRSR